MNLSASIFRFLLLTFFVFFLLASENGINNAGKSQAAHHQPDFMEGDIIFHISSSTQCKAVQLATGSPYSHCGIILKKGRQLQVVEAVQTVRWTPISTWIKRGDKGHYVLMRLKDRDRFLPEERLTSLRQGANPFFGRQYDLLFQWSDDKIYCSELVWKIYQRGIGLELAPLRQFADYKLNYPQVQKIIKERYGTELPKGEQVIAPSDLMQSPLLETVYSGNFAQ